MAKIKEKVHVFQYIPHGEYVDILAVQYSHYCPKCGICLDNKMNNFYDLKFCFNCGKKIEMKGLNTTPHPIKPIRMSTTNFNELESIEIL